MLATGPQAPTSAKKGLNEPSTYFGGHQVQRLGAISGHRFEAIQWTPREARVRHWCRNVSPTYAVLTQRASITSTRIRMSARSRS